MKTPWRTRRFPLRVDDAPPPPEPGCGASATVEVDDGPTPPEASVRGASSTLRVARWRSRSPGEHRKPHQNLRRGPIPPRPARAARGPLARASADGVRRGGVDVRRRAPPRGHAGGARRARPGGDQGHPPSFVVGEQVERRPALAAEIAARGHLVALHGYRHRPQPVLSGRAVEDDLARGVAAVEDATGVALGWHRPPYGLYSPAGVAFVRQRGLKPLLWSRWARIGGASPPRSGSPHAWARACAPAT